MAVKNISILIKILIISSFFAVILINGGCINLKIELPDDPGWGIGYFVVSNELNNLEDYEKPLRNIKISSEDKNIYVIIKILNIEKMVHISWVWYGPDKKIVKRSSATEVNIGGKFLEYFVIWDSIDSALFHKKKGKWSVTVLVDDNFLASKSFPIN